MLLQSISSCFVVQYQCSIWGKKNIISLSVRPKLLFWGKQLPLHSFFTVTKLLAQSHRYVPGSALHEQSGATRHHFRFSINMTIHLITVTVIKATFPELAERWSALSADTRADEDASAERAVVVNLYKRRGKKSQQISGNFIWALWIFVNVTQTWLWTLDLTVILLRICRSMCAKIFHKEQSKESANTYLQIVRHVQQADFLPHQKTRDKDA